MSRLPTSPFLFFSLTLLLLAPPSRSYTWPSIEVSRPEDCSATDQAFDPTSFRCFKCGPDARPTKDGHGCECLPGQVVVHDAGRYDSDGATVGGAGAAAAAGDAGSSRLLGLLQCLKCPAGSTATRERDRCIRCPQGREDCRCRQGEIRVERDDDGDVLEEVRCVACSAGHEPTTDGARCAPCRRPPILEGKEQGCNCSVAAAAAASAGVCLPENAMADGLYSPGPKDEVVRFDSGEVHSAFFKTHVRVAATLCHAHKNGTACQLLGNLCALALHDRSHPACALIFDLTRRRGARHVPQLYFPERMATSVDSDEEITNVYNVRGTNSRLNITAAKYSLTGHLLSLSTLDGLALQMCNGTFSELDASFDFATRYSRSCRVPAERLFQRGRPEFFDLYVPYTVRAGDTTAEKMYALPVLLLNADNNRAKDNSKWTFTNRIFLSDAVTGIPVSKGASGSPTLVRYLSKMHIRVQLINTRESPEKAGRVYPPVVAVEYGVASADDAAEGAEVDFEFSVTYSMDLDEGRKDIEISLGVMSVFAVLWAALETWSWARRSGRLAVDPSTLAKLVAFTCGSLAHAFLAVMLFSSLYWFVFFKEQSYLHVILPTPDQEKKIKHYLIVIFILKCIDVLHLLLSQMSVDVFLVDWERPHAVSSSSPAKGDCSTKEMAVSVWRTYLVANEWNELQTRRKTSLAVQVMAAVFVLVVCGAEDLASADPGRGGDGAYRSEPSFVCRFALGCCVYLAVAAAQTVLWCGLYEGLVENKLDQFTDVCSLANISVFVMAERNFGYYIHGKSAHGFADTDMATLIEQLQREADDFAAHRGLQAGSDDQVFVMTLPVRLRSFYDKIVTPASQMSGVRAGPRLQRLSGNAVHHMVDAYSKMNRFLTRFLEHALRDLDYEVRDKMFLEKVLDVEFQDVSLTDKAVFYTDHNRSFNSVLLYGHEFSLTVFDMVLFVFVDLVAQDFVLAGIVTFFVGEAVKIVRYVGGKSNLAKKTLIDKRFLI